MGEGMGVNSDELVASILTPQGGIHKLRRQTNFGPLFPLLELQFIYGTKKGERKFWNFLYGKNHTSAL